MSISVTLHSPGPIGLKGRGSAERSRSPSTARLSAFGYQGTCPAAASYNSVPSEVLGTVSMAGNCGRTLDRTFIVLRYSTRNEG